MLVIQLEADRFAALKEYGPLTKVEVPKFEPGDRILAPHVAD
jgi:hypothetical protein